jgi:hypothetical protein
MAQHVGGEPVNDETLLAREQQLDSAGRPPLKKWDDEGKSLLEPAPLRRRRTMWRSLAGIEA